jgi:alpha-amylase
VRFESAARAVEDVESAREMKHEETDLLLGEVWFKRLIATCAVAMAGCSGVTTKSEEQPGHDQRPAFADPFWRNATIYFLITDRFANGDPGNDRLFDRKRSDVLRGFEGGDIAGVTQKIKAGYFNDLGVDAIWLTPLIENTHGYFDEGYGATYAYHGYWPLDWTAVDPSFGTEREMAQMIAAAHDRGLRVIADVIINHAGPATDRDPNWPSTWVREQRACDWSNYENNVSCWLGMSTWPSALEYIARSTRHPWSFSARSMREACAIAS